MQEHSTQLSLSDYTTSGATWDYRHPRAKAASMSLARMVCHDLQPYSIVDDIGFRDFVHTLEPRYKLPTRHALSNEIVPALYEKVRGEVALSMNYNCVYSLAVTTDGWTSNTNDSYISFTSHYVDASFQVHNECLQAQYFPDSHTGDHLALCIEDCIKQWLPEYLQKKIPVFVVTDNAANIKEALRQLPAFTHLTCFGHSLQLTISHAVGEFSGLKSLFTKARQIVSHFRHSSQASHRLLVAQVQLSLPQHKLKMEVATRWNSTFKMMERLVEQKDALSLVLSSTENAINLTPYEWRTAADYCKTLKPFEEATTLMSGSTYPTVSMVIPVLNILLKKLRDSTDELKDLKLALAAGLNSQWPQYERDTVFATASLVDPRFKRLAFSSDDTFKKVVSEVSQRMERLLYLADTSVACESMAGGSTTTSTQESQDDSSDTARAHSIICMNPSSSQSSAWSCSLWSTFRDMVAEQLASTASHTGTSYKERVERELQMYLNESVIAPEHDIFDWWSSNSARFPVVAKVARMYLAIPATSVPSEQLFSTAGLIISEHRNRLKPGDAEQLVFLAKNLRK